MEQNVNVNKIDFSRWQREIAFGDDNAFRKLFDHFAERLTNFSFSITRNKEIAEEITSEVFVKVWKNREKIQEINNLNTYLYKAAKNTSLNYLSRKFHEVNTDPFDFVNIQLSTNESPEQHLISNEIFKKISDAVESLPPKCKIIFKLVREDGLKYQDVAEILNISINTVDAQMVIAIKKISEKVKLSFDTFPLKVARKR